MGIRAIRMLVWTGLLALLCLTAIPPAPVQAQAFHAAPLAQSGVRAVVVNPNANIRIAPAIGAEVITTVDAGYVFEFVTGRSADNQWLRVDFNGDEGWVHIAPLVILSGDITSLEVGDPRSIPYGGFGSPRAGQSSATSDKFVRVTNGLRVRAGPGQAYPTLANMFANTIVPALGRTASNGWVQINYEGTLGWVATAFLEFLDGASIASLPIGGVVADSPPLAEGTPQNFFDTLLLMLSRLDLSQPALDNIRGKWTDAALAGHVTCRDYPARPSDYNIPVPLLAAYFDPLDPLQRDFNNAMYNLRLAIDLFIETCNLPGINNGVGQATVIGALDIVNLVDRQFASLRSRILPLIPAKREPGPDECLFTYRLEQEILKIIGIGQIVRVPLDGRNRAAGFCIDLPPGQIIAILGLSVSGNNAPTIALSPFDNPTNFIAIGRASVGQKNLNVGPVLVQQGGRHLLLLYDQGTNAGVLNGEYAVAVILVPPTGLNNILVYDPITDTVFIGVPTGNELISPGPTPETCPSITFTCELLTCGQAFACLAAGNTSLDPDGNGLPCTCPPQ